MADQQNSTPDEQPERGSQDEEQVRGRADEADEFEEDADDLDDEQDEEDEESGSF